MLIPVILSGGMGTRLWPLSRAHHPKQFLDVNGTGESLMQATLKRVYTSPLDIYNSPIIVCHEDHRFLAREHADALSELSEAVSCEAAALILEPESRNTAAAITLAALHIHTLFGDEACMVVLPSDHVVQDDAAFHAALAQAYETAQTGALVTFGITPNYAETGYGYIQKGEAWGTMGAYNVAQFVEKPNAAAAERYVRDGAYFWNSGMFVLPVGAFLREIAGHAPDVFATCLQAMKACEYDFPFIRPEPTAFAASPTISIDYAVMEHTDHAAMVPLACGWSDAGAWDTLWRDSGARDEAENAVTGDHVGIETRACQIVAEKGMTVATLGVDNLIIIATRDCVMVADKSRAQEVKLLVDKVKETAPELVQNHMRVVRPWGHYEAIGLGERYQVKRITVKPKQSLSMQLHYHRAEHWIVVQGTAEITRNDVSELVSENASVYIPIGTSHRLHNPGKLPLELIEVQSGTYLGEDDIVRFDDCYGRGDAVEAEAEKGDYMLHNNAQEKGILDV